MSETTSLSPPVPAMLRREPSPFGRLLIVAIAAALLLARLPASFLSPQFWAEDGLVFRDAYLKGLRATLDPLAGYCVVVTRFLGWLGTVAGAALAPALYAGASVAITLLVVWLVTSPRFPFPHKPLAAIAVVAVPSGSTVLGVLANSQWVVPIGLVAILLMRAPGSRLVLVAETAFVAAAALNGPFSILLAPIAAAMWSFSSGEERSRLALFTSLLIAGAIAQFAVVMMNLHVAALLTATPVEDQFFTMLYKAVHGLRAIVNAGVIVLLVGAALLAWRQPLRNEKLFLLAFVLLIFVSAMAKQRADLATIVLFNDRYTYSPTVFAVWYSMTLLPLRTLYAMGFVAVSLVLAFGGQRERIDFNWQAFARDLKPNDIAPFPVAPRGWLITKD